MPPIRTHEDYFTTLRQYREAPEWQKEMLLRGTLLTKCTTIEPANLRGRLRHFWETEARKRNLKIEELQTWA